MVPASHPDSDEKEFQWRISFSEPERLLVTRFNDVQLMCYILLKIIKNEIIKQQIKEDTLTSYHFKTCMLYMLENTPSELWIPEHLASCLFMCLRQLQAWVEADNCPNYFIPGENMFDRITNKELMLKLGEVLHTILSSDLERLIKAFETDNIGMLMQREIINPEGTFSYNVQYRKLHAMSFVLGILLFERNKILAKRLQMGHIWFDHACIFLYSVMNFLENKQRNVDRTEAETTIAKSLILPFINVAQLSSEVVKKLQENDVSVEQSLTYKAWDQQWQINCYSKLKQASAMLMLGNYQSSEDVLLSVIGRKKISFCSCSTAICYFPHISNIILAKGIRPDITVTEVLAEFFQPCVVFLPNELQITPTVINYEMIRSFAMPPLSGVSPLETL